MLILLVNITVLYCSIPASISKQRFISRFILVSFQTVQTNGNANVKGVGMHTVAMRREKLEEFGLDLVQWTEQYVAPVKVYVSISSANTIQLLLPGPSKITYLSSYGEFLTFIALFFFQRTIIVYNALNYMSRTN